MTNLSKCPIRLTSITATEMATLFALNKYSSPAKLIEQKRNPVQVVNNHVRRGKLFEPAVLEALLLDLDMKTSRHEGPTIRHSEHRIAATPDAYVLGTNNVVECKSIMSHSFVNWYDEIPVHYHIQLHTQMMVTGAEEGYIAALEFGDPRDCEWHLIVWKAKRNEKIFELFKEEVARFWDCWDKDVLFRADFKMKRKLSDLLEESAVRLFPTEKPISKEEKHEEAISSILSLFD